MTCIAIKTKEMYILSATQYFLETIGKKKMNQRTISQFSIFWLVIVLTFGISSAFTVVSKLFERNYVRIFNELDNELLFFHCKSKDDDLGLRNLQPGTYWEFSFHQRVFGTTLYFCNFWYTNSSKIKFHAVFDVYRESTKFLNRCGAYICLWKAKEDGLYLYNFQKGTAVKMHDWEIGLQIQR